MGNLLRLLTREDQDSSGGKGDIFLDFESKYLLSSALCGRALLVIGHVKVAYETGLVLFSTPSFTMLFFLGVCTCMILFFSLQHFAGFGVDRLKK